MKKFLKVFAMILLVPILFISSLVILLIIPLRKTINDNVFKDIISSIDIEKEVENNPEFKEEIDANLEPVYEITREVGIEDEVVLKIINRKEVKDLIGDVTNNVFSTIITGKSQKIITPENIEEVVSVAIDDVNESGVYEIPEETKKEIINVVKEESVNIEKNIPDTTKILKELPKENQNAIELVRFILSNKFLTYVIGALAISLMFIILLNLTHFKWIKASAIVVLISSIFSSLITAFISLFNIAYIKTDYSYISDILTKVLNTNYIISGSIFVLMILILITYHIIRKRKAN